MKISGRLASRLRTEGIVPEDAELEVRRVNPSRSQRNVGAWSWCATWQEGCKSRSAGSQYSMTHCLAAPRWSTSTCWSDVSIDPVNEDGLTYRLP